MKQRHVVTRKCAVACKHYSSLDVQTHRLHTLRHLSHIFIDFYTFERSWPWWYSWLFFLRRLILQQNRSDWGQLQSTLAEGASKVLLIGSEPMVNATPTVSLKPYQKRWPQGVTMGLLAISMHIWHWYFSSRSMRLLSNQYNRLNIEK
jgi:hypothetical protein